MSKLFNVVKEEFNWAGRKFSLETGKMARQADGAVVARYGNTSVLCTVVGSKIPKADADFLLLSVHYIEKFYAVGRIPGGFFKREGKPSETEVLTSRLIDRPIRPLFPEGFFNEVQVICTILSHDQENDPAIVSIIAASAALALSGIPFQGPLGAARVGYIDGQIKINPTFEEMKSSKLDLVVAGTASGVLMVESEAKELSEETMLEAVNAGHESFQEILKAVERLKKKAGKPEWEVISQEDLIKTYVKQVEKICGKDFRKAYGITAKQERRDALDQARLKAVESRGENQEHPTLFTGAIKKVEADILRSDILKDGKRLDGRDLKTIRPIESEVGILPRTHGSALFTRGETQALVVATLGTAQDEQIIDGLEGEYRQGFMLHYNFPPFSVGECGRVSSPGRREVGHGKLAWRAINPMMPVKEEFPYAVRIVSEILESNGSSSMATVCGTSLALMDAGVPLSRPVAGIAMGLVKEGKNFAVLSDILGDEDHLGDMDFKVAGTDRGITALQMDIKITSVTKEIMDVALAQARDGRLHILNEMNKALGHSREEVSEHAPRMVTIQINKEKIRDIIGPGGKVIREICETTQTKIDIDEEGSVTVAGHDAASLDKAVSIIKGIACDPEIGEVYDGKVVKIVEFGAFVNFMGSRDGLVHVSEIAKERVANVRDYLKEGDTVKVKVVGFDKGKIKLSIKALLEDESESEIHD